MDKTISTDDVNGQLDRVLKDVEGGSTYTITNHGKPVARIVPAPEDEKARKDAAWKALLTRLHSQPALNLGPWSRDEAYD
jgi:prevent-host-death family protein